MKTLKISLWVACLITSSLLSVKGQEYHDGIPKFFPTANVADLNDSSWVRMSYGPFNHPSINGFSIGNNVTHAILTTGGNDMHACYEGIPGLYLNQMPDMALLPDWDTVINGNRYVMRLGDSHAMNSGQNSSRVTYYFKPTVQSNVLLVYFAFVVQSPGHNYYENSLFHIEVLDSADNLALHPGRDSYFLVNPQGDSLLPNPLAQDVNYNECGVNDLYDRQQWCNWSLVAFDLRDYIGREVKLRVTTMDCAYDAHYGYGYFTARGVNGRIEVSTLDNGTAELTVPAGFVDYKWYRNDTLLSNMGYKLSQPQSADYRCVLTSLTGAVMEFTTTFTEQRTIAVTCGDNGTISPVGPSVSVAKGSDFTLTVAPNDGYKIIQVIVDGVDEELTNSATYSHTFTDVQTDHSFEARFAAILDLNESDFNGITVFPNPTTGELRIENGEWRVDGAELFDVYGRNILSSTRQHANSSMNMDLSRLPAGVYFLRIITEKGNVVRKVVKNSFPDFDNGTPKLN